MNKKTQLMTVVMMVVGLCCQPVVGQVLKPEHQISKQEVRVFFLKSADASLTYDVVSGVLTRDQQSDVRMSIDPRNNAIVVSATPEVLDRIQEIINQIDIPAVAETKPEIRTAQLSVVVLVDAADEIMAELLPIPGAGTTQQDLLTNLADLQRIPSFKRPRVAGAVLTRISVGGDQPGHLDGSFSNESSSRDGICELQTAGQLRIDSSSTDGFIFQGSIELLIRPNLEDAYQTEIQTRAALTRGRPVVLGFTSLQGIPCVIVVEVF
ncbi:MAG TPA: secretin N-terminal domain-containing protein [Pirellulaceae bacterium]|nr:secretin N-terminal domain-containing protein [Pirellulaceae bacterium]